MFLCFKNCLFQRKISYLLNIVSLKLKKYSQLPANMSPDRCPVDPNSLSNPNESCITHMDFRLSVDFQKHVLKGFVDLIVERKDNKKNLRLDARDLNIITVRNRNNLNKIPYELSEPYEPFGSVLEIKLPKRGKEIVNIRIEYETSPKARALQWLEPGQTAGKQHPYVFSQCQTINARSIVPCQDTPSVKFTYSAEITVPKELTALMSAISDGVEDSGFLKKFKFQQKVPIPSYLLAIVVGCLESRKIGPKSHVWCEKEFVDKAAEEFSDTEKMLNTAEGLLGEYVWEKYDLLVLPPSFPYGGMENPCLTFVSSTLLTGDKSMVDIIAHEIVHSWTGNLVTNKNWQHFWLNEGFTTFFERKIISCLHGEKHRHFYALSGWKDLKYDVETLEPKYTVLIPDMKESDPDDYCNSTPYEKGHTLLFYLEQLLGGNDVFEKFLLSYVQEYQKQSIDTDVWKSYLYKCFSDKEEELNKVDWNAWFHESGMPPVKPDYDCTLVQKCLDLSNAWVKANEDDLTQFSLTEISDFAPSQIWEFIGALLEEEPLSLKKIEKLNEIYKLNEMKNPELRLRWIRLGLRSRWSDIVPRALEFINEQGRLKYIIPIYRDLYEWEEFREKAIANYKAHSSEMFYVTVCEIRKILHLTEDAEE